MVSAILAQATPPSLMFLGDSLTAGYQLPIQHAFPAILQERIGTQNIQIINAGVSGDTSYTLLNRLPFTLHPTPNVVFLCIGANDGLRGHPISTIQTTIDAIIQQLKKKEITVVLAGISLPKNYTNDYIDAFDAIFPTLAKKHSIPLMPFLLNDVAGVPSLNLSDRIHPNASGHQIIAKNVETFLRSAHIISSKNTFIEDNKSDIIRAHDSTD